MSPGKSGGSLIRFRERISFGDASMETCLDEMLDDGGRSNHSMLHFPQSLVQLVSNKLSEALTHRPGAIFIQLLNEGHH